MKIAVNVENFSKKPFLVIYQDCITPHYLTEFRQIMSSLKYGILQNNEQNKMWIITRQQCGPLHPTNLRKGTGGNRTRDLPKLIQLSKPLGHGTLDELQHS
jgi:hypothetical protein